MAPNDALHTHESQHQHKHAASQEASSNGAAIEAGQQIAASIDIQAPLFINREMRFSFKKQLVKKEDGTEIKRPPIVVTAPVPTWEGFVEALANEKVQQFMLDTVEELVKDQIRAQLSDEEKPVMRPEDLDISKLTLQYIASIPKSERTGGGIAKEVWEEWEKDYIAVMSVQPHRVTKEPIGEARAAKAAKMFVGRYNVVRTDKKVLSFLREQLSIWAANTQSSDDYGEVFKYLDDRAVELLNRDSDSTLAAL